MIKNPFHLILIICCFNVFAQFNKTKILEHQETVYLKLEKTGLKVSTQVSTQKYVFKANEEQHLKEEITYNGFTDIQNIEAYTFVHEKKKTHKLWSANVYTSDVFMADIYHSDYKKKSFWYPNVDDNSTLTVKYTKIHKEPRLLTPFYFQDDLDVDRSQLKIVCHKDVKIGYKLFGQQTDKIVFSESTEGENIVYTWKMSNLEAFKPEAAMSCPMSYIPHVVYFIEDYTLNSQNVKLLGSVDDLYKWYASLVKNINQTDQTALKQKTLELIADKKTEKEKAKAIFDWVQQNVEYVAYEDGLGGFVPRDASLVFSRKHGDCKDMSNLLNEMFKYANLESYLTWIGTRDKPYAYQENATPVTDNHMILCASIDGKNVFLDATGKFTTFPLPTAMIQGKEALIGKSSTEYMVQSVPVVDSFQNLLKIDFNLGIKENALIGSINAQVNGYGKSRLIGMVSGNYQKEDEILKSYLIHSNEKIQIDITNKKLDAYADFPAEISGTASLDNWVKEVGGKWIIKPIVLFPLKTHSIEVDKRKFDYERDFKPSYDFKYILELPQQTLLESMPKNFHLKNELLEVTITYQKEKNQLVVSQKIEIKTLKVSSSEFELWNKSIKEINNQYNQSIIFTKS